MNTLHVTRCWEKVRELIKLQKQSGSSGKMLPHRIKVYKTQQKETSTAGRVKEMHSGRKVFIVEPCWAVTEVRRPLVVDFNLPIEHIS